MRAKQSLDDLHPYSRDLRFRSADGAVPGGYDAGMEKNRDSETLDYILAELQHIRAELASLNAERRAKKKAVRKRVETRMQTIRELNAQDAKASGRPPPTEAELALARKYLNR